MKVKTLLIALFSLLLVGAVALGAYYAIQMKKGYELQLVDKDIEIQGLHGEINSIGEMVKVYQTAYDVKSGIEVKEEDLEPIQVPVKVASQYVQDPSDIVGDYYLINIVKGTPLVSSMILPFRLDRDMRFLDVAVDEIPIGLEVDDYVDIRIAFRDGEDFICMSNKQVAWIGNESNVIKLVVNERDIHVYESMKVDASYIDTSTKSSSNEFVNKVYAIEYVEGGSQEAGLRYYPIRLEPLRIVSIDPNMPWVEALSGKDIRDGADVSDSDIDILYGLQENELNKLIKGIDGGEYTVTYYGMDITALGDISLIDIIKLRSILDSKYIVTEGSIKNYKNHLASKINDAGKEYSNQTDDRKKAEEKAAKEAAREASKNNSGGSSLGTVTGTDGTTN